MVTGKYPGALTREAKCLEKARSTSCTVQFAKFCRDSTSETQFINLGLDTEAISKGDFLLDYLLN